MRDAVIVFLTKGSSALLLHSYTDATRSQIYWQGVSGFIDEGENPVTAATRELREELGITANPDDLSQRHALVANNISFTVFTLKRWQGEPQPLEEGIMKLRWFPVDQLPLTEMHPTDEEWMPKILKDI